jgi:hypothetical protein
MKRGWDLPVKELWQGFVTASDQWNFDILFNGDKLMGEIVERIMIPASGWSNSSVAADVADLLSRSARKGRQKAQLDGSNHVGASQEEVGDRG